MSDDRLSILIEQAHDPICDAEGYDDESMPLFDSYDQQAERNRIDQHGAMRDFVIKQSIEIKNTIISAEKSKAIWRNVIMSILLALLCITVLSIGVLVWFYLFRGRELPITLLIGLFSTVIIQIISLLTLFVKFVTNVETLRMHKVVTHKLLDYLSRHDLIDE